MGQIMAGFSQKAERWKSPVSESSTMGPGFRPRPMTASRSRPTKPSGLPGANSIRVPTSGRVSTWAATKWSQSSAKGLNIAIEAEGLDHVPEGGLVIGRRQMRAENPSQLCIRFTEAQRSASLRRNPELTESIAKVRAARVSASELADHIAVCGHGHGVHGPQGDHAKRPMALKEPADRILGQDSLFTKGTS